MASSRKKKKKYRVTRPFAVAYKSGTVQYNVGDMYAPSCDAQRDEFITKKMIENGSN